METRSSPEAVNEDAFTTPLAEDALDFDDVTLKGKQQYCRAVDISVLWVEDMRFIPRWVVRGLSQVNVY